MIEILLLAFIWVTLFLGICKLRVDLSVINENLQTIHNENTIHLKNHTTLLEEIHVEVSFLHSDLQDEIKKALGGTL